MIRTPPGVPQVGELPAVLTHTAGLDSDPLTALKVHSSSLGQGGVLRLGVRRLA